MCEVSDRETTSDSSSTDFDPAVLSAYVAAASTAVTHIIPSMTKRPLHNSVFTGRMRLDEWQVRHGDGMRAWLGVDPKSFNFLLGELAEHSDLRSSRFVQADEKVAIFLYICRNACGVRSAAEAFQRSLETTANAFREVLECVTSLEFYTRWVRFPDANEPPSPTIMSDSRFSKWFERCIGAIDGTHIPAHPPVHQASTYRTRKGALTMNVLAAASFELKFIYILAGWEGSAHDGKLWAEASRDDLKVPSGRFLLADAGFGSCKELLVPFRGTRYHLQEWAKSKLRPRTAKELYNLRHSSARNVIERIFGVAKRRWAILAEGCEYDMEGQARVVYAVAVLHNLFRTFEHPEPEAIPSEAQLRREALEGPGRDEGDDAEDALSRAYCPPTLSTTARGDHNAAEIWREGIAQSMWSDWLKKKALRQERRSQGGGLG